jgi:hypothetical protein
VRGAGGDVTLRSARAWVGGFSASLLIACTTGDNASRAAGTARADTLVAARESVAPSAKDSVATLALLEQQVQAIERDTIRMDRRQVSTTLGAGTRGVVTGWRVGPVWRRIAVRGRGENFGTDDTYWLASGQLLGARLSVTRPKGKPVVDSVWFRERRLYRWIDPERRHLNVTSRSTQYQVTMLRNTLDSLIMALAAGDRAPRVSRDTVR